MKRLRRIRSEFGTRALVGVSVMLVGLAGMALFDPLAFSNFRAAVIAATTVVVFNLQFWPLSDPAVVNTNREARN